MSAISIRITVYQNQNRKVDSMEVKSKCRHEMSRAQVLRGWYIEEEVRTLSAVYSVSENEPPDELLGPAHLYPPDYAFFPRLLSS